MTASPALISPDLRGDPAAIPVWMTGRRLLALWLLVAASLLTFVGGPPVTRTQEARVLETAREMLDNPGRLDNGLIPELNGAARLRKPPLAYWLSAGGFLVGGVGEGAGRVPTAILAWLLVGVTFAAADRLLGRRPAFFAAASLATGYLFFRHARLAETDLPAALFVTTAVAAFLRAADAGRRGGGKWASVGWHHVAAIGIGLAFNAKGPPGLFPLAFLLAFAACERRWDVAIKFVTSGAIATAAVVGGAWFAYAGFSQGTSHFATELREVGKGEGHLGPFWFYVPVLIVASAPWSAFAVAGVVGGVARWRDDRGLRVALIWLAAVLVPLSLTPQKQPHYALTLLPPLALLAGWAIDLSCGGRRAGDEIHRSDVFAHVLLRATWVAVALVGVAGVPIAARVMLGHVRPADWVIGAALAMIVAASLAVLTWRGRTAGVAVLAGGLAVSLPVLLGVWHPPLEGGSAREVAAVARAESSAGPYCFYKEMHLPLVFELRTPVPMASSPFKLETFLSAHPDALVIAGGEPDRHGVPANRPPANVGPWRLVKRGQVSAPPHLFELYRAEAAVGAKPSGGE